MLSLVFVRRVIYELFLKLHLLLSFITVTALLIHLLPTKLGVSESVILGKFIFPLVAIGLWTTNAVFRLARIVLKNFWGVRDPKTPQATVTHFGKNSKTEIDNALRIDIQLQKSMEMKPGQYVYLFFSGMGIRHRFQAHPYVITWWDNSMKAMNISFLIQPQKGISHDLMTRNSIRRVVLDGPYGKDLHLEAFEAVVLIAKGIGIAGILPYIRHMVYRRVSEDKENAAYKRGLITRKIDVYWVLEDNSQDRWIKEWATELQKKDSGKVSR